MKYKQGLEAIARGERATFHFSEHTGPKVVCSWCRRTMSEGSLPVSHGICTICLRTHFPESDLTPSDLTPGTSDAEVEAAERRCWPKVEAALPRPSFITRLLRRIGVRS